jgi:hypothetical protein
MNLTIDLNTIVSGLALAAILYVARTVTSLEKRQAVADQEGKAQDDYSRETRARVMSVEEKVGELEVDVASMKSQPRRS